MDRQLNQPSFSLFKNSWKTQIREKIEDTNLNLEQISPISRLNQVKNLIIVIPSFNDWAALEKLLFLIDETNLVQDGGHLQVLIIDDYSTQLIPDSWTTRTYQSIKSIKILRLKRNLGHQRAIAVGLCYVYHHIDCEYVVVMDGDGEDNPFEIERLLKVSNITGNNKIIFAKRSKRSEGYTFKILYYGYKKIFSLLTGREINVGNFSLLPASLLKNIVIISEIWNHYSSGIYRSRIPYLEIDIARTKRLDGKPQMNLISLVTHGLSSIAVYGDYVGTRILMMIAILLMLLFLVFCLVILIRLFTDFAIPGWTTYVVSLLFIAALQLISIGVAFSLLVLASRNSFNIIPERDYKHYIDKLSQFSS